MAYQIRSRKRESCNIIVMVEGETKESKKAIMMLKKAVAKHNRLNSEKISFQISELPGFDRRHSRVKGVNE